MKKPTKADVAEAIEPGEKQPNDMGQWRKDSRREEIYTRIGERLRVLREMRGESQEEVGKLLGWTRAQVSHVELATTRIYIDDLMTVANHFGVTINMLVSWKVNRNG